MKSRVQNSEFCYRAVARIHTKSITSGFLSLLGEDFLTLLYRAIDRDPHSVLIIERKNTEIIGFVAGGIGMKSIIRELLKDWVQLIRVLLPCFLKLSLLRKCFDLIWLAVRGKPIGNVPSAELLSIAVDSDSRRGGVGMRLYQSLKTHFCVEGHNAFCIVVGDTLEGAHQFYLKAGAEKVGKIVVHEGDQSVVYQQVLF